MNYNAKITSSEYNHAASFNPNSVAPFYSLTEIHSKQQGEIKTNSIQNHNENNSKKNEMDFVTQSQSDSFHLVEKHSDNNKHFLVNNLLKSSGHGVVSKRTIEGRILRFNS